MEKPDAQNPQNVILSRATEDQLARLTELDEQAKRASTGASFSDREREKKALFYRESLSDSRFAVLSISSPEQDRGEVIGFLLVDYNPEPETDLEATGEVFVEGKPESSPVSKEDMLRLFQNRTKTRRAHLRSMALESDKRNQGIGKKALDALLVRLRSNGIKVLTFETGVRNTGMRRLTKGAPLLEVLDLRGGYGGVPGQTRLLGVIDTANPI